jgi:hypothetical protein
MGHHQAIEEVSQLHKMHAYLTGSHSVTFTVEGFIKLEHINYTLSYVVIIRKINFRVLIYDEAMGIYIYIFIYCIV